MGDMGIPDVKPAIESIRGRWERKMSPRRRHAILQARVAMLLTQWAGDRGEVGTEWRFYLVGGGESESSLVPDVAYVSFERLPLALGEAREKTCIAPDLAVEILSPGDRRGVLEEKIGLYLANGSIAVVIVDPLERTIEVRGSLAPFEGLRFDGGRLFANV
jgi:Uma2 family endonuclease